MGTSGLKITIIKFKDRRVTTEWCVHRTPHGERRWSFCEARSGSEMRNMAWSGQIFLCTGSHCHFPMRYGQPSQHPGRHSQPSQHMGVGSGNLRNGTPNLHQDLGLHLWHHYLVPGPSAPLTWAATKDSIDLLPNSPHLEQSREEAFGTQKVECRHGLKKRDRNRNKRSQQRKLSTLELATGNNGSTVDCWSRKELCSRTQYGPSPVAQLLPEGKAEEQHSNFSFCLPPALLWYLAFIQPT